MNSNISYFKSSFFLSGLIFSLAYFIGGLDALWITVVLSVLEITLSFDNAIVNAQVLKDMDDLWRKRFITWGMAVAVFGMRFIFPLLIVSIALGIDPISSLLLAINNPDEYAHTIEGVHTSVMGFGGTFLWMVALKFFIDTEKDVHWLKTIETKLTYLGKIEAVQAALTLIMVYVTYLIVDTLHDPTDATSFLTSSIWGLITYILVDGIEAFIGVDEGELTTQAVKSGLASFIYLEVLDSSFSFDGVISGFALTNNLFIITAGLSVGALFVRSITLLMVDKGTVDQFRYMEHGAFWAIFGLAAIMFISTVYEIPEVITGLLGAVIIGLSILSSVKHKRQHLVEIVS